MQEATEPEGAGARVHGLCQLRPALHRGTGLSPARRPTQTARCTQVSTATQMLTHANTSSCYVYPCIPLHRR